jgi:hypothetical protein
LNRAAAANHAAAFAAALIAALTAATHRPRRHLRSLHVTRHVAAVAARIATFIATGAAACIAAAIVIHRTNRSAAGARDERQQEHDKRAFHDFPPKDLGLATLCEEESGLPRAELGRYHWYRRHNRQNPANR